ncbi:hypothetical protein PVAND_009300 [Polypedilum vanderplanki]|uniref:Uncharacterized protein n=1 Tax=Polypedilum vanderplanki TaxID=319348 RepID=A0A9J6CD38_POLVA|nr:hypothetical protein PVAND_009300 [Polypedilum vanderplanki]
MDRSSFFNNLQELFEAQLEIQANHLKQQLAAKDAEIAQLQQQVVTKDATIAKLQDQLSSSEHNMQHFRNQLKQSARGNDNLRTDLQTYILALGKAKDDISSTKGELVSLQRSLDLKANLLATTEKQLSEAEDKLKIAQRRIDSLEKTMMWQGLIDYSNREPFTIFEDESHEHTAVDQSPFMKNRFKRFQFYTTFDTIVEQPADEENASIEESFEAIDTKVVMAAINIKCTTSTPRKREASTMLSPQHKQSAKKKRHFTPLFAFAVY